MNHPWADVLLAAALLGSASAWALDFRSVSEPFAILYDAPSTKAQKVFVLTQGYPVEVVVKLEGWSKVRDDTGEFAWIESNRLSDRRTVTIKAASAEARQTPDENSPVVFTADKSVILELVSMAAGWAKVRHNDGPTGFIKVSQLWGL
jgi:SH3-like domain-containing protein